MKDSELKIHIIKKCRSTIEEKIETMVRELKHLADDIADDTKSSAGDKFETSREMTNTEREKISGQVALGRKQLALLDNLSGSNSGNIETGTLIKTDKNYVFIAVSLGPVTVEKQLVLVVSPLAPLAQAFMDKKKGDKVNFNKMSYTIEALI